MSAEWPKKQRDQAGRMARAFDVVDDLLLRLGLEGLQRASGSSRDALQAVAQTAHNAGLISVERQLDALATHVQRYLEHDPLFTMAGYRAALGRAWLLNRRARERLEAGERPDALLDVLGEARRKYVEADAPITVQPLGAAGWVSDTGYVGVTVHLRAEAGELLVVNNARPTMHFGADPRGLYGMGLPGDAFSLRDLARGAFTLYGAKVSADGRLSMHAGLRFEPAPYEGARAYAGLMADDWGDLVGRLRDAAVHPVSGADSILACVRPHVQTPVDVDVKAQRARAQLRDAAGASLWLDVPLRGENNLRIDNLERLLGNTGGDGRTAPRASAWFGRVQVHDGRLVLDPMTAIFEQSLRLGGRRANAVHLGLESLKGAKG